MNVNRNQEERGEPQRGGEEPRTLRWELALTIVGISVTLIAGMLAFDDILGVLADRVRSGDFAQSLAQLLFLSIVGFLIYGASVYLFARRGHLRRLLIHRAASERELSQIWKEKSPPALAILVPSYK